MNKVIDRELLITLASYISPYDPFFDDKEDLAEAVMELQASND